MTPKEKAEEIFYSYYLSFFKSTEVLKAKSASMVLINEMINELKSIKYEVSEWIEYWEEVKKEIKKL